MYLQGETVPTDEFPIRVFDRSGTSHRYESGGIHGMERVDEFHRVEIVWTGTPEQVVSGVGLEHRASAFLAQKGLDPENWVGEMPGGIKFL